MKDLKLYLNAGVRYWNDSKVNGVDDIDFFETEGVGEPKMPCAVRVAEPNAYYEHYRWQPIIDVETGQVLNWHKGTTANVLYKVCDDCEITCTKKVAESTEEAVCTNDLNYYCPSFLAIEDDGYGDYIIMNINENGFIHDWNPKLVDEWIKQQLKLKREEEGQ